MARRVVNAVYAETIVNSPTYAEGEAKCKKPRNDDEPVVEFPTANDEEPRQTAQKGEGERQDGEYDGYDQYCRSAVVVWVELVGRAAVSERTVIHGGATDLECEDGREVCTVALSLPMAI